MKIKLLKKLLISAIVIFGFTNVNAQLFDFTGDLNNFDITGAASTDLTSGTTLLITAQDNRGNIYLQQKAVADGGYGVVAANYAALKVVLKNNTSLNRLSLRTTTGGTNNTVGSFQTISTGDTEFKTYIFPLTVGGDWTGTVENWRIFLGFNNTGVGNAETLEFDSIEFLTELPAEPEPVITVLDIQQVGNNPVDVGETTTFEITYKTDGSGPDITGNTWRLYQGAGVSPGFEPIVYTQTNGANATVQVSFTWLEGYVSGTYDMRLFNANPKDDFDWAPAGDHSSKINNAGSLEPTEGYLGLDVDVSVKEIPVPVSEFVTNPDFEHPYGENYTGSTSEMTRGISTAEAQSGTKSLELAFSKGLDASKINWLFTTDNGVGVYDPDFPAGGQLLNVTMWVKKTTNYDRSVVITVRTKHYLDGAVVANSATVSATTTPDTEGAWEQLSFPITFNQAFDEVNLWIAVDWEDGDPNNTNALNGDLIYIDNIIASPIVTLSAEKISKDDASVRLFPNPVRDILRIKSNNSRAISKIEIYSLLGKRVLSTEQTESINVSALSPGVYVSKIYGDKDSVSTKRFIKE